MDGAWSKGVSEAEATIECQTATPAQLGLSRRQEAVFAWSTPTKVTLSLG